MIRHDDSKKHELKGIIIIALVGWTCPCHEVTKGHLCECCVQYRKAQKAIKSSVLKGETIYIALVQTAKLYDRSGKEVYCRPKRLMWDMIA